MSWTTTVTKALADAAKTLGSSVAYIKKVTTVAPTDAQVDHTVAKAQALADQLEAVLEAYIDSVPGVPSIVAKLAAHAALGIIDSAIAGAGEAVKGGAR